MVDYEELDYLYSREALSKLSKNPKKVYKNGLVALFITSLMVGNLNKKKEEFSDNIRFCKDVLKNPLKYQNEQSLKLINNMVQLKLKVVFVRNPDSEDTKNKIIKMMRSVIKFNLNGDRYLIMYEELDQLLDAKSLLNLLYQNSNPNIRNHHWIEFDLEKSLVHTFPEFITYADLISLWNIYLEKNDLSVREAALQTNRINIRIIDSEIHALHISLWTQAVTFVESYLYYIFYNIRKGNYSLSSTKAQGFIRSTKPDDNQIFESLILPEFKNDDNQVQISKIISLHGKYKSINNTRNRFIHASAFYDSNQPHLLPLISSGSHELLDTLETCTGLVIEIEKILPSALKILFWWDSVQHPIFNEYKKGNFIKRTDI
ncbi:hypothetical protein ABE021_12455 [Sporosarcina gallistercoris]|uniref:hypothetical protein n=1 Tax=Sporosarcina gallistercoris TaxID=2762245 RepID=UPI003D2C39E9